MESKSWLTHHVRRRLKSKFWLIHHVRWRMESKSWLTHHVRRRLKSKSFLLPSLLPVVRLKCLLVTLSSRHQSCTKHNALCCCWQLLLPQFLLFLMYHTAIDLHISYSFFTFIKYNHDATTSTVYLSAYKHTPMKVLTISLLKPTSFIHNICHFSI